MKKTLLAFAVLSTFAAVASAQSSVTVYGNVDVSAAVYTNTTAAGNKKFKIDSGELSTSRFGLKGSEELDKDLSARFQVESAIGVDTGTAGGSQFFNRRATVGVVSKSMGALDIGRQTTVDFDVLNTYDPSNYYASGTTNPNSRSGASVGRKDNSIKFTSASFSGFTIAANHAAGEGTGNVSAYQGLSVGFTEGPMGFAAGASQTNAATSVADPLKTVFVGGKFGVDAFTVKATLTQNKTGPSKLTVIGAGVDFALDQATTLTAAFYNTKADTTGTAADGKANELVGLAKYALSKRTTAYTSLTYVKSGTTFAKDTVLTRGLVATGKDSAARLAVGVNHTF